MPDTTREQTLDAYWETLAHELKETATLSPVGLRSLHKVFMLGAGAIARIGLEGSTEDMEQAIEDLFDWEELNSRSETPQ